MLAVCAAWGLDPFAGQVWLLKQKGRDAEGVERWRPSAGRDGYLAIANRQPDFRGIAGDVVRERDYYAVEWKTAEDGTGMVPVISHRYEQGPSDDGQQRKVRGNVLGAWAFLFRTGRLPVYYYAPWEEHHRDPSKSAWNFRSAMILKAAQSMVLRLGYSITGLVPVDEMNAGLPISDGSGGQFEAQPETPWLDDDLPWGEDETASALRTAVRRAWESGNQEWNRARLAMRLTGNREALLADIAATLPVEGSAEEVLDGEPEPGVQRENEDGSEPEPAEAE
jgi:hypothetical protein